MDGARDAGDPRVISVSAPTSEFLAAAVVYAYSTTDTDATGALCIAPACCFGSVYTAPLRRPVRFTPPLPLVAIPVPRPPAPPFCPAAWPASLRAFRRQGARAPPHLRQSYPPISSAASSPLHEVPMPSAPSVTRVGVHPVYLEGGALLWRAGLAIDADGAPRAYAPRGSGLEPLDHISNAGGPGNWWGVVTDTGEPDGTPLVQGLADPAPGYYVSATALRDRTLPVRMQRAYLDSSRIPYLAIPRELRALGAHLGDVAVARKGDCQVTAIIADIGPPLKLGEGSIALADALRVPSSPRRGGCDSGIEVVLFAGSHATPRWPRASVDVAAQALALLAAWGGWARAVRVLG